MRKKEARLGFFLCVPALAIIGGVVIYPFGTAIWLAFNKVDILTPHSLRFVGLKNMVGILQNPLFFESILRTLVWTGGCVGLQISLGLGISLILNKALRGRNVMRALVLFPYILPTVAVVLIWRFLFSDIFGVINYALMSLNILKTPITWFSHPSTALLGLIIMGVWQLFPFVVICLLAVLQSIPRELYEVGRIDGGNSWHLFRHITFPYILPTILIVMILRTIWTFNRFDVIHMTTRGGPIRSTTTLPVLMYERAFHRYDLGGASAIGVYTVLILLLFSFVYFVYWKKARW